MLGGFCGMGVDPLVFVQRTLWRKAETFLPNSSIRVPADSIRVRVSSLRVIYVVEIAVDVRRDHRHFVPGLVNQQDAFGVLFAHSCGGQFLQLF